MSDLADLPIVKKWKLYSLFCLYIFDLTFLSGMVPGTVLVPWKKGVIPQVFKTYIYRT